MKKLIYKYLKNIFFLLLINKFNIAFYSFTIMKKLIIIIFLIYLSTNQCIKAQRFSPQGFYNLQSLASPMILNPAYTGIQINPQIGINYYNFINRLNLEKSYQKRINFNYNQYVNSIKGGLGINANYLSLYSGNYVTCSLGGLYSYEAKIKDYFNIRTGLEASWNYNSNGMLNTNLTMPIRNNYFNLGAGLSVLVKSFYGGLSIKNIFEPKVLVSKNIESYRIEYRNINFHSGVFINFSNDFIKGWMLNPNIMYEKRERRNYYLAGMNISKSWFTTGFRVFLNNKAIPIDLNIGINAGKFKVGYSTRYLDSHIGIQHELALIYYFNKPEDISTNKMINNFRRIF